MPSPVVLCLSGGGFRATFYHLGVVRLLATTGWLKKVTHVFSVSGGSILAAHMAMNWDAYTSSDDNEFQRVTSELIRFGQSDVRGRIMRRWIPFLRRRTSLFQQSLRDLYSDAKLRSLPDTPKFHFLSTSLTSGQLCAFDKDQWIAVDAPGAIGGFAGVKSGNLELSRVVAASAAFPPLFTPVRIRAGGLSQNEAEGPLRSIHYLTDGGVFDNLGVAKVLHVIENLGLDVVDRPVIKGGYTRSGVGDDLPPEKPSWVIVSDASASFDAAKGGCFPTIVSRTSRSMEILMGRLAERDIDELGWALARANEKRLTNPVVHLSIKDAPPPFNVNPSVLYCAPTPFDVKPGVHYETQSPTIQHGIRYARTDLDRFDSKLIWYLMRHGYEVAAARMCSLDEHPEIIKGLLKPAGFAADVDIEDEEKLLRFIKSQQSRFRKDNLYGLLSMPYSLFAMLVLLIIALKIACSVLQR
jgi:predicted acylesterase/phospholipase RssA